MLNLNFIRKYKFFIKIINNNKVEVITSIFSRYIQGNERLKKLNFINFLYGYPWFFT